MAAAPNGSCGHRATKSLSRSHDKGKLMSSTPSGPIGLASKSTNSLEGEAAVPRARPQPAPRVHARQAKRAEDTGAGCRANAAADLVRARAPGGGYMRERLERSAAIWTARASLLERLE